MNAPLVEALRRAAVICKDELADIAHDEGYDLAPDGDDGIGLLVDALTRSLTLTHGFDSVTAHRLAFDAVASAFLDND